MIAQMVPERARSSRSRPSIAVAAGRPTGLAACSMAAQSSPIASPVRVIPDGRAAARHRPVRGALHASPTRLPRRRFLDALTRAVSRARPARSRCCSPSAPTTTIGRCCTRSSREVFAPGVVNVLPMTADELEAAVVGPAERAGVKVEPALLAALVADAADRPGTLPLLEYALTELFDQRTGRRPDARGVSRRWAGFAGVLSRSAEAIYAALDRRRAAGRHAGLPAPRPARARARPSRAAGCRSPS